MLEKPNDMALRMCRESMEDADTWTEKVIVARDEQIANALDAAASEFDSKYVAGTCKIFDWEKMVQCGTTYLGNPDSAAALRRFAKKLRHA